MEYTWLGPHEGALFQVAHAYLHKDVCMLIFLPKPREVRHDVRLLRMHTNLQLQKIGRASINCFYIWGLRGLGWCKSYHFISSYWGEVNIPWNFIQANHTPKTSYVFINVAIIAEPQYPKNWSTMFFRYVVSCMQFWSHVVGQSTSRASPVVLDLHMHLHFFIRDANVDLGMWPSGPCKP